MGALPLGPERFPSTISIVMVICNNSMTPGVTSAGGRRMALCFRRLASGVIGPPRRWLLLRRGDTRAQNTPTNPRDTLRPIVSPCAPWQRPCAVHQEHYLNHMRRKPHGTWSRRQGFQGCRERNRHIGRHRAQTIALMEHSPVSQGLGNSPGALSLVSTTSAPNDRNDRASRVRGACSACLLSQQRTAACPSVHRVGGQLRADV
jgi:hypothetical protein